MANCVPAASAVASVSRNKPIARNKLLIEGRGNGWYIGVRAASQRGSGGTTVGEMAVERLFTWAWAMTLTNEMFGDKCAGLSTTQKANAAPLRRAAGFPKEAGPKARLAIDPIWEMRRKAGWLPHGLRRGFRKRDLEFGNCVRGRIENAS